MIYIHSFYEDLFLGGNDALAVAEHDKRDGTILEWMRNNNLRMFPICERDFVEVAHLFAFLTEQNALVTLMFTEVHDGCEKRCHLVKGGKWTRNHPSRAHALCGQLQNLAANCKKI
jgi:hypothetical protein